MKTQMKKIVFLRAQNNMWDINFNLHSSHTRKRRERNQERSNIQRDNGKGVDQQKCLCTAGGSIHCKPLWTSVWQQLLRLKYIYSMTPKIPFLDIYHKVSAYIYQKTCARLLITALFNSQKLETNRMPINQKMNKL